MPTNPHTTDAGAEMADKHVESVITKHRERAARGLSKYGVTLERTDLSRLDWLRHLQEELMDAAAYAERLIADEGAYMSSMLNRRVKVEQKMLDAAKHGASVGPQQLREWALELGTPAPAAKAVQP